MNTSLIALGIAVVVVTGLIVSLAGASLLVGAMDWMFGKPKFVFLKTTQGASGLAFLFKWNEAKEETSFNRVKIRAFNPFGSPTQIDVTKEFEPKDSSFALDLDMGESFKKLLAMHGLEDALVQVEMSSTATGLSHQFEMKGHKFLALRNGATKLVTDLQKELEAPAAAPVMEYGMRARSFVADTVPGKGPQLKVLTNPAFAGEFVAAAGGAEAGAAATGPAKENFSVKKVWIAPGCIVCNACENIYPEVFEVKADTCIIRPNPPLDNGLKIQEAAEACPVEVIKYDRA